jgi:hypothetical protein
MLMLMLMLASDVIDANAARATWRKSLVW